MRLYIEEKKRENPLKETILHREEEEEVNIYMSI